MGEPGSKVVIVVFPSGGGRWQAEVIDVEASVPGGPALLYRTPPDEQFNVRKACVLWSHDYGYEIVGPPESTDFLASMIPPQSQ